MPLAVILGLLAVLNPLAAQAQTWSGGGANDNWTNGANWGGLINMDFTGFNFNNYVTDNGDEGIDLDLPDLSAFDLAWDMSRFTTSGNIVVIPEPSRALLMMFGLAGLALCRRRQVTAPIPASLCVALPNRAAL